LVPDREIDQRERDCGANHLEYDFGAAGPLEHEPNNRNETDENGDTRELAHVELLPRRVEQPRVAIGQCFPHRQGEDDGDEIAERGEDEEARVTLSGLEITSGAESDEEADVHTGVVPEE